MRYFSYILFILLNTSYVIIFLYKS